MQASGLSTGEQVKCNVFEYMQRLGQAQSPKSTTLLCIGKTLYTLSCFDVDP
jgi:hypothetical protein